MSPVRVVVAIFVVDEEESEAVAVAIVVVDKVSDVTGTGVIDEEESETLAVAIIVVDKAISNLKGKDVIVDVGKLATVAIEIEIGIGSKFRYVRLIEVPST